MERVFSVTTEWTGQPRVVQVHVYDDVQDMRHAANEYHGGTVHAFAAAYGACNSNGAEIVIRLVKGYLNAGVVAHEITHAAMAIYHLDVLTRKPHARAINHMRTDNELIAYLVGHLVTLINDELHALGCYQQPS